MSLICGQSILNGIAELFSQGLVGMFGIPNSIPSSHMTDTVLRESIQEVERAVKAGGGGNNNNKKNRGCFVSMVGPAGLTSFPPSAGSQCPTQQGKTWTFRL